MGVFSASSNTTTGAPGGMRYSGRLVVTFGGKLPRRALNARASSAGCSKETAVTFFGFSSSSTGKNFAAKTPTNFSSFSLPPTSARAHRTLTRILLLFRGKAIHAGGALQRSSAPVQSSSIYTRLLAESGHRRVRTPDIRAGQVARGYALLPRACNRPQVKAQHSPIPQALAECGPPTPAGSPSRSQWSVRV